MRIKELIHILIISNEIKNIQIVKMLYHQPHILDNTNRGTEEL